MPGLHQNFMNLNLLEYWNSDKMELRIPTIVINSYDRLRFRVGAASAGYFIYDSIRFAGKTADNCVPMHDVLTDFLRECSVERIIRFSHIQFDQHFGVLYNFPLLVYLCKTLNLQIRKAAQTELTLWQNGRDGTYLVKLNAGFSRL